MEQAITKNTTYHHSRLNPLKFGLWIGMASIMMMFAALTSAYMVRRAGGNWLEFSIPNIFYINTVILLVSSVFLHYSYHNFKKKAIKLYKTFLILAFIFGSLFIYMQYLGWVELFSIGIDLKGNPSGSFLYVITGIHGMHIMGGLAVLTVAMINAFTLKKFTEKRKLNFELTLQYWHFVDLLWVYLLIFLIMSR